MSTVRVEGVWKSYPRWQPGTRSVRSVLTRRLRVSRRSHERRWALRDVTFSVERGRALGVIGHNGAGKSTLLRLISGLGRPSRGRIQVVANSASVLSLGDTFSLELTGRENATTAAVIAGLRVRAARAAVPAILQFAELQGFEDAPVRSYSDGMKLRLAFGVVAQLVPDLLVLDEVMAVGDLRFHERCMAHINDLRSRGTGVVLASHDLGQIEEQCDHVVWLDHGRVRAFGEAKTVIEDYQTAMHSDTLRLTPLPVESSGAAGGESHLVLRESRFGSQEMRVEDVVVSSGGKIGHADPGGRLDVALTVRTGGSQEHAIVSVAIHRSHGDVLCVDLSTDLDGIEIGPVGPAGVRVILSLEDLELQRGEYVVDVGVYPIDWAHAYDYHWHAYPLNVGDGREAQAVYRPQRRRWSVAHL